MLVIDVHRQDHHAHAEQGVEPLALEEVETVAEALGRHDRGRGIDHHHPEAGQNDRQQQDGLIPVFVMA